jgi:hypothetical protein
VKGRDSTPAESKKVMKGSSFGRCATPDSYLQFREVRFSQTQEALKYLVSVASIFVRAKECPKVAPNPAFERTGQQFRCWLPSSLRSWAAALHAAPLNPLGDDACSPPGGNDGRS